MLMHYVKSSDRGLQARRDGGPRATDMLGAHVVASPQVRSHTAAHGQRKDVARMAEGADWHAISRPLYEVQQAFMHSLQQVPSSPRTLPA